MIKTFGVSQTKLSLFHGYYYFIEVIIGFSIKMYATTQGNRQSLVRTKQNNNEAVRNFDPQ